MIKVKVCETKHEYNSDFVSWFKEQFYKRKKIGEAIWFIVSIETSEIKLRLPSAGAPKTSRGKPYHQFNPKEQQIIDMWEDFNLKQNSNVNKLLRFLYQIKHAVA